MFVRRKPNKSGSFSIQVVDKVKGHYKLIKSFGSSKSEEDLAAMEKDAVDFISTYGGQTVLDFEQCRKEEERVHAEKLFESIVDIRQNGVRLILEPIYDAMGFSALGDDTLKFLSIARICRPKSKVATVEYLKRYFDEDVNLNRIYRYIDTLYYTRREQIQQISVEHTRRLLGGRIGIVSYDVTTLYFETAREDSLRSPGFSKDGKTAESQIVLGLLVSRDGYPLSYNIFDGGQYEGRTMIPIIDDFVQRFSLTDFIVVADAGLMSRKNISLLKQAGYKFILGGRIKKESKSVQDWVLSLEKDPHKLNETVINGDERIIVSYSDQRAAKDRHNRDKGFCAEFQHEGLIILASLDYKKRLPKLVRQSPFGIVDLGTYFTSSNSTSSTWPSPELELALPAPDWGPCAPAACWALRMSCWIAPKVA